MQAAPSFFQPTKPKLEPGWGKWFKDVLWDYTPPGLRDLISPPKVLNKRTEQQKKDPNHYLTKAEMNAWKAAFSPLKARNARIVATSLAQNLLAEGAFRLPQFGAWLIQGYTYTNPADLGVRAVNKILTGKFSHPYDDFKEKIVDRATEYVVQDVFWHHLSGGMPYQAYRDPHAYYNAKITGDMRDEERWDIRNERDAMRLGWWLGVEIRFLRSDPVLLAANKIAQNATGQTVTPLTHVSKFNRVKTYYKYVENSSRSAAPQINASVFQPTYVTLQDYLGQTPVQAKK